MSTEQESELLHVFAEAAGTETDSPVRFTGRGILSSAFAVNELAAVSIATAGLAAGRLIADTTGAEAFVVVDRALASAWFGPAVIPIGWQVPSAWDALAGDYESADGWIRLHTNAPRHRAAALRVLRLDSRADRRDVTRAARRWVPGELEEAVVIAGGCAAVMRTAEEWRQHPQGVAVAQEPLVRWTADSAVAASNPRWMPSAARPLKGIRVLDPTRVLAGPVATRLLAGLGADVLRVDPPDWDEPALAPEMTLGKRSARLDMRTSVGRELLDGLVAGADVLVHGYRPGVLDSLIPTDRRRALRPGLIEVSLDAYGWSGPWSGRRGFDSLVQMSTGIAEAGMRRSRAGHPVPLPVQALDHATGYLMAAAAMTALARLRREQVAYRVDVSLARTAMELRAAGPEQTSAPADDERTPHPTTPLSTPWGRADLLRPPLTIGGEVPTWTRGPRNLGADPPIW